MNASSESRQLEQLLEMEKHEEQQLLNVAQAKYQSYQRKDVISEYCSGLLTYLLTPWCRFLLEKLNGSQLVKKFPAFHGTQRFITALTSVCHLSLSWASPIQSIYPHPTSWRSALILSNHLCLGLLPSGLHTYLLTPWCRVLLEKLTGLQLVKKFTAFHGT